MIEAFAVPAIEEFDAQLTQETQILFHGVNKSGSLAMATAMRDAYSFAERSGEFYAHYFQPRLNLDEYLQEVQRREGHHFFVAHYLYGAIPPSANRIFVTQFRHPLPRILSCYNWLKRLHDKKGHAKPFPTLDEWVERTKGIKHSQIAQFGIGFDRRAVHRRTMLTPENIFEICIAALEREVLFFGIAEQFEESVFLFAALCRLRHVVPWVRDQRNPGRMHSTGVAPASRGLIQDVFEYDFKLYAHALEIFNHRIASINFGPDLAGYKQACLSQYNDRILPGRLQ